MKVIPPLAIMDGMLTSSTAAEPGVGEAAYNIATGYTKGQQVILGSPASTVTITIASPGVVSWSNNGLLNGTPVVLTTTGALPTGLTAGTVYYVVNRASGSFQLSTEPDGAPIVTTGGQSGTHTATAQIHRKYESVLEGTNTGNPPAIDDGTNWIDIGPTNRWASLDLLRNTATYGDSPLTIVLTPGVRVDSIGLIGMLADSVEIDVSVGSSVYNVVEDLSTRETLSWYDYFFLPFSYQAAVARFDLPPYTNGVITVTLTRATGQAKLGGLVLGTAVDIGRVDHGVEDDAVNYSSVTRDDFGNATLVPRRSVPESALTIICEKSAVNKVRALRTDLNAVPALWSGLDDTTDDYFEAVLLLGFYRRFLINLEHPNHAIISLELEEV